MVSLVYVNAYMYMILKERDTNTEHYHIYNKKHMIQNYVNDIFAIFSAFHISWMAI